jgi:hypothetical protein
MEVRTTQSIVRFSSRFRLRGLDGQQPAGDYRIECDDEQIGGVSFIAYRRVATFIHLPAVSDDTRATQMVPIDPAELEDALGRDRAAA